MGYRHPRITGEAFKHLYPFTKKGALPVEVHWTLEKAPEPLRAEREHLWERALPLAWAETETLCLSPEDLFLHVCHHAAHHGFVLGFQPLCDIAEIVRLFGDRLDWEVIRARAGLWKVEKSVSLTVRLLDDLFGKIAPDPWAGISDSHYPEKKVVAVGVKQIHSIEDDADFSEPPPQQSWRPSKSEGFTQKARILMSTLFPPPKAMRVMYQTENLLKAYLIRPFDLFTRYTRLGQKLFKRAGRRDHSVAKRMATLHNTDIIRKWILDGGDRSDQT